MRSKSLLPLMVAGAVAAGCGSPEQEVAAISSNAEREIVLPVHAPEVEVASPLELGRPQAQPARRARKTPRRVSPAEPTIVPPVVKSTTSETPSMPAAVAAPAAIPEPVNDRELPPGKTVTIIPASSGTSIESDGIEELPPDGGRPMVIRGGGTCRGRGRGPGIGIAMPPRPGLR